MKGIKSFFWYLIPFSLKSLIPLITLPIFTRYLNSNDFGLYALSIFFGTFLSGIANFGLLVVYERNFFESKKDKHPVNLLFTNINFIIVNLFIVLFFSSLFKETIANLFFNNSKIEDLLIFGLIYCGLKSLNEFFYMYLKNGENAKRFSQISLMETFLSVTLSLHFVVNLSYGIDGFILGQILSVGSIFLSLYGYLFFVKKPSFSYEELKKALKLSFPLTPRTFFWVIGSQFDRYMLGYIGNLSGAGIYDIGLKIANVGNTFSTTLKQVFSPKVYQNLFSDDSDRLVKIGKYLTQFFYLSVLVSLMTCLFSFEIISILTPKEFHDAAIIISILSILNVFYFFGKQGQLIFAKKSLLISILSFGAILLNIILNIPMILYFGAVGAAWATLISGVLSAIITFYFSQKYTPIVWEYKIMYYLTYILLSFTFILVVQSLEIVYLQKLLFKLLILVIYLFMGYRFNMFNSLLKLKFFKKLN